MRPGDLAVSALKGPTPLWASYQVGDLSMTGRLLSDNWCLAVGLAHQQEGDVTFALVVTGEGAIGWINIDYLQAYQHDAG